MMHADYTQTKHMNQNPKSINALFWLCCYTSFPSANTNQYANTRAYENMMYKC